MRLRDPTAYAVLFSADWCGYCRRFLPEFEAAEGTLPFVFAVADLTDLNNPWWETFEIEVVPTILGFRGGELVFRIDGVRSVGLGARDFQRLAQFATGDPTAAST